MGYITKFGGYTAGDDLSSFDWIKKWNTAAVAEILGIGFERVGEGVSASNDTGYTFSGLISEFGTYVVAVSGASGSASGVVAVEVDGSVGNEIRDDALSANMSSSWWLLTPSSFANGDINVLFAAAQTSAAVAVWKVNGFNGSTYDATASGAEGVVGSLSVSQRTVILAQMLWAGDANADDAFWSGLTEWVDELLEGTVQRSTADKLLITDETSLSIVSSTSGSPITSLWTALAFYSPITYFPSGQGIEVSKTSSNALSFWSWNNGPVAANVEIAALIRPTAQSDTFDCGIVVRGNGTSEAAADGYAFVLSQTSAGLRDIARLVRIDTGVVSELDTDAFSWSLSTNYWLKLRARGSTLQARIWAEGSIEPTTWNIEVTDSEITEAGSVGVFHRFTGSTFEVGYLEAKILYAEWPEDEIPNNWTVDIQGGPQQNKVSFKPDVGPSIDRRRASTITRTYQVQCPGLTQTEYLAFVSFYHTTLKEGTLPFTAMDPFTGVEKTFKFGDDNPAYRESIQRSPGSDYTNGIYQVDFTVMRLD